MRKKLLVLVPLMFLVGAVIAAVAFGLETEASQSRFASSSSPGVHGSVGAMKRLERDANTPASAIKAAQDYASRWGGNPSTVALTIRTLRNDLGPRAAGNIYGFSPDGKAVCFMYWEHALRCPGGDDGSFPTPGVVFAIGGGIPASATTNGVAVPSALVGIATDDVRSITLVENGAERSAEIRNNAFYLELRDSPAHVKWNHLRVEYASGKTAALRVPAQFGGR